MIERDEEQLSNLKSLPNVDAVFVLTNSNHPGIVGYEVQTSFPGFSLEAYVQDVPAFLKLMRLFIEQEASNAE